MGRKKAVTTKVKATKKVADKPVVAEEKTTEEKTSGPSESDTKLAEAMAMIDQLKSEKNDAEKLAQEVNRLQSENLLLKEQVEQPTEGMVRRYKAVSALRLSDGSVYVPKDGPDHLNDISQFGFSEEEISTYEKQNAIAVYWK